MYDNQVTQDVPLCDTVRWTSNMVRLTMENFGIINWDSHPVQKYHSQTYPESTRPRILYIYIYMLTAGTDRILVSPIYFHFIRAIMACTIYVGISIAQKYICLFEHPQSACVSETRSVLHHIYMRFELYLFGKTKQRRRVSVCAFSVDLRIWTYSLIRLVWCDPVDILAIRFWVAGICCFSYIVANKAKITNNS